MNNIKRIFFIMFVVGLICFELITAVRYYVDPNNINSTLNGTSWESSFTRLEDALAIVSQLNDEIWLVGGETYIPQNANNRSQCFHTKVGTTIYGGFVGDERTIYQRPDINSTQYKELKTIISGDIGNIGVKNDNCYHVITYEKKLTLDRVIIADGNANYRGNNRYINQHNALHRYGGGLITKNVLEKTELYLIDTTFENNSAVNGGALWFAGSATTPIDVIIRNCSFVNNRATNGKYEGGYGGSIYFYFFAKIIIYNTRFYDNYAEFRGGAIYQDYGGVLECYECIFDHNTVTGYGGAIFSEDRNSQTQGTFPIVQQSLFTDNSAKIYGGAICFSNNVNATLVNNLFYNNTVSGYGGAISLIDNSEINQQKSMNNTYIDNYAEADENTSDIHIVEEFLWETIDENFWTVNITDSLMEIGNVYHEIYPLTDLLSVVESESDMSLHVCYVDISNFNETNQTGESWETAYHDLQDCIDDMHAIHEENNNALTTTTEIWVAEGEYHPTKIPEWKTNKNKNGPLERSFVMYKSIKIYGGFNATETKRNQRDFVTNPTYLSCQLSETQYCNQIVTAEDDVIIDGFIFVKAGYGNIDTSRRRLKNSISIAEVLSSTDSKSGSGIYSNSTTITVANSIFYGLFANGKGGAVYCIGQQGAIVGKTIKSPTFINVAFIGNRANRRGGAISADAYCNFDCQYCTFDSNSVAKKGGAIYLDFDADPTIKDSIFLNNYALESGGCVAADGQSNVEFINTKFRNNYAKYEGGCLYSGSGVTLDVFQGFQINQYSFFMNETFKDNYLLNDEIDSELTKKDDGVHDIGQSDAYLWPYSTLKFSDESQSPTPAPTNYPTAHPIRETPNFIIFIIDDIQFTQKWDELLNAPGVNLNGETVKYFDIETPNFDEFMEESVIFPRSYSNPKCSPSRFSLLTGRNVVRSEYAIEKTEFIANSDVSLLNAGTKVTVPFSRIYGDDAIYNIPYTLQNDANRPYYTGFVGKWHLMSADDNGKNFGCEDLQDSQDIDLYRDCTRIVTGQGFEFVDAYYHSNIGDNEFFSHNPEWMLQQAQLFMDDAIDRDSPFFLYFSSTLTHEPNVLHALTNFTNRDTPKGLLAVPQAPKDTGMSERDVILNKALNSSVNISDPDELNMAAANIWIDDTFGALINYLKNKTIYDDTFIVLMNDHGMGAKGLLYEQGSRILQSIRHPPSFGYEQHVLDDFITTSTDLAGVIFELAKINISTDYQHYVLDSQSWLQDVQDRIDNVTDKENDCCQERFLDVFNSHTIISKDYKYIFRATTEVEPGSAKTYYPAVTDREQLYDLRVDPDEQYNIIDNDSYSNITFKMKLKMLNYVKDVACLAADKEDCLIPNITYIPEWSSYSPPTPAPTTEGYTCDPEILFTKKWKNVKTFRENKVGDSYREIGEQKLLLDYYEDCGDDIGQIEYVYNFTHIGKKVTLTIIACCGDANATFGDYWPIPTGFTGNDVYNDAHAWDEEIAEIDGTPIQLKDIIAINVAVVLAVCCCFVGYIFYAKRKSNREIQKLSGIIVAQQQQAKIRRASQTHSSHQPDSVVKCIELGVPGPTFIKYSHSNESHGSHSHNNHDGEHDNDNDHHQNISNPGSRRNSLSFNPNDEELHNPRKSNIHWSQIPNLQMGGYLGVGTSSKDNIYNHGSISSLHHNHNIKSMTPHSITPQTVTPHSVTPHAVTPQTSHESQSKQNNDDDDDTEIIYEEEANSEKSENIHDEQ